MLYNCFSALERIDPHPLFRMNTIQGVTAFYLDKLEIGEVTKPEGLVNRWGEKTSTEAFRMTVSLVGKKLGKTFSMSAKNSEIKIIRLK